MITYCENVLTQLALDCKVKDEAYWIVRRKKTKKAKKVNKSRRKKAGKESETSSDEEVNLVEADSSASRIAQLEAAYAEALAAVTWSN